ncbi:MAG TPA: DCC1-like thiol-disulfide oxidoreductase family protein [Planctomycetaceae bacterium]|nr:DCC1-like thiol-disulfide oxidoreductase family protein [Planctomycetaceae bacterium]
MSSVAADLALNGGAEWAPLQTLPQRPIVFFDGVCGLCNFWVDFLISRDPDGRLAFAPLQGETARQLLSESDRQSLHSLVLWTQPWAYRKSAAVVRIAWQLGGVWSVLGTMLWLVPLPIRNLGYDVVARNRYRLFGKKETCRMPTPAERTRLLP